MDWVQSVEDGVRDMGRNTAKDYYHHDGNTTSSAKSCERDMLFEFFCYAPEHFLFGQLWPFPIALGTQPGEFRKMILGMKVKIPGELVFILT